MHQLALKYRPRTFDDLVGQPVVQIVLRQMVLKEQIQPALLFTGPRGTGKTTSMRILAAALNCDTPPGPCGHCVPCAAVFNGTSQDLLEIDAASNGLVDDIRQLRQHLLYATPGRWRLVALDEAHSMSNAAFNALLKVLEDPPPYTVFLLLTTEPHRIPDTVASRCTPHRFRRIAIADIVERLAYICQQESLTVEPALLALIAEHADGGMRDAVMLLDQVTRVGISTVEQYAELVGDTDPAPAILDAICSGNLAATYAATTHALTHTGDPRTLVSALAGVLRDICILHAGGELAVQGEALTARTRLAATVGTNTAVAAMKVLWDLETKIRPGGDPRCALDLAVAMLSSVCSPTPAPTTQPPRRLSLADMQRINAR